MPRVSALFAVFALLAATAAAAPGGYAEAPFRDHAVPLARAAAAERLAARARGLAAAPRPGADSVETAEAMRAQDMTLFLAGLAAASPRTAAALEAAVEDLLAQAEAGEAVAAPAGAVADLADRARAVLLSDGLDERPAVRAALMAELLLAEGGVAEAYEEAVEGEVGAYPAGWAALQRVKAHWASLREQAAAEPAAEIDEMIARLDALFPAATPPARLAAGPEEPEAHAHRLVGFLETVADAELYPGRDLARAATLVRDVAASGCARLTAGEGAAGVEMIAIAEAYAEAVLQPLVVLAPEARDSAEAGFSRLRATPAEDAASGCAALLAALEAGRAALAPAAAP